MRYKNRFLMVIFLIAFLFGACMNGAPEPKFTATLTNLPIVNTTEKPEENVNTVTPTINSTIQEKQAVTADFSIPVDPPLDKKFDFMNSGIATMERYRRDINLLDGLQAQSLRIDLFWGSGQINGWKSEMVTGTAENLQYDFTEIDELSKMLKERGMAGYWSYCYNPIPLQNGAGYATKPDNLEKWGEILTAFANHFKKAGIQPAFQSIWNEPDLQPHIFYNGKLEDYEQLYQYGVTGLHKGDPDAFVGGPDLALNQAWISPFLDFVETNQLPLDFFSFHSLEGNISNRIGAVRAAVQGRPYFATTELVLSEYNLEPVSTWSNPNGPTTHYSEAALILESIKSLVNQPDITRAYWAQFMDSGVDTLGVVSIGGHRRAAYNAFKLYAMMPIDRRKVNSSDAISSLASTDGHTAGVLLWNLSGKDQTLEITLNNVPFTRGILKVYRIDADHASYFENPANETLTPDETKLNISTNKLIWTGQIPMAGVIYLELKDGTPEIDPAAIIPSANLIRTNRYFPDHSKKNYAEFDPRTWTIRLGMGPEKEANSEIGFTLEDIPSNLNISFVRDGDLKMLDSNSILALRVDFEVADRYAYSVLIHDGLYDPSRSAPVPWGTKSRADKIVKVDHLDQIQFAVSDYAPGNWNGRAIFTFLMQDTGPDTRVKITISQ